MRTTYTNWNAVPLMLDITQAAILMQITPENLRKLCQQGKVPAIHIGKEWRIDRDAIREKLKGAST